MSVIVNIDHETGNLSEWDSNNGGGAISVTSQSALTGTSYGLQLGTSSGSQYGQERPTRNTTKDVRLRFYLDLSNVTRPSGNCQMYVIGLRDEFNSDAQILYGRVYYGDSQGQWLFRLDAKEEGGVDYPLYSAYGSISPTTENYIEIRIIAADSGQSNGEAYLWVNGSLEASATDIDNDGQFQGWDYFYAGVFSQTAGFSGNLYLDEFIINDDGSEIGPLTFTNDNQVCYLKGAQPVTVDEDTTLRKILPNNNYGAYGTVMLRYSPSLYEMHPLFRWDLSGISSSAKLDSAKIILTPASGQNNAIAFSVYKVADANGDWIEGISNGSGINAGEPCWNWKEYNTGSWAGSAGCWTAGTDYINTALGSFSGNSVYGTPMVIALNSSGLSVLESWFGETTNNGFIFIATSGEAAWDAGVAKLILNFSETTPVSDSQSCYIAANTLEIDHEEGNLTDWESDNGGGYVGVSAAAACAGSNYGLWSDSAQGTSQYAYINFNKTTNVFRTRFYINVSNLTPATGYLHIVGIKTPGQTDHLLYVRLRYNGSQYYIQADVKNDDDTDTSIYSTAGGITGEHYIEIMVKRATGSTSNDGEGYLWVDGDLEDSTTSVDNYDDFTAVGFYEAGNWARSGSWSGNFYIDEIVLNTTGTLIGPVSYGTGVDDNQAVFLKGLDNTLDNQPAYLRGSTNTFDSATAYLEGATSANNSLSGYTRGSDSALGNTDAYLAGSDSSISSLPTYIDAIGQILVPDGDVVDGNWINEASGTNLYPSLADDNDSTYVWIDEGQETDTFTVQLSDPDGVPVAGRHFLSYRIFTKAGTNSVSLKCELYCGAVLIKSDTQTVPSGVTEYIIELSQGEIDNITDYTNLTVKFTIQAVS